VRPNRRVLPGKALESEHWMVLHRPFDLADKTGKVGNGTRMVQYRTEAI
jgi:hypothetical protein